MEEGINKLLKQIIDEHAEDLTAKTNDGSNSGIIEAPQPQHVPEEISSSEVYSGETKVTSSIRGRNKRFRLRSSRSCRINPAKRPTISSNGTKAKQHISPLIPPSGNQFIIDLTGSDEDNECIHNGTQTEPETRDVGTQCETFSE